MSKRPADRAASSPYEPPAKAVAPREARTWDGLPPEMRLAIAIRLPRLADIARLSATSHRSRLELACVVERDPRSPCKLLERRLPELWEALAISGRLDPHRLAAACAAWNLTWYDPSAGDLTNCARLMRSYNHARVRGRVLGLERVDEFQPNDAPRFLEDEQNCIQNRNFDGESPIDSPLHDLVQPLELRRFTPPEPPGYVVMHDGDWIDVCRKGWWHLFRVSFRDLRLGPSDVGGRFSFELPLLDAEGHELALIGQFWPTEPAIMRERLEEYGPVFEDAQRHELNVGTVRRFAQDVGLPVQWFVSDALVIRVRDEFGGCPPGITDRLLWSYAPK